MLDEGLLLALEHRGFAARVVGYCERESYAATTLLARMEEASLEPAPIWCGDFADFPAETFFGLVDIVVGGIPCQPFSVAGKRLGEEDERWLWPILLDIAARSGAWGVGLENVGGFIHAGLEPVLNDFAESGWNAEWLHLSAGEVGAGHKRERIFLLGVDDAACQRIRNGQQFCKSDGRQGGSLFREFESTSSELADCESLGRNPRRPESIGITGRLDAVERGCSVANPCGAGREGGELGGACHDKRDRKDAHGSASEFCSSLLFAPGPQSGIWGDVIKDKPHLAPSIEPGIRVLVDGVAYVLDESRADQLRCAGNGVVALQAAVAFAVLLGRVGLSAEVQDL